MTCDAEQVILNFSSPVLGFYFQVGGGMNRVKTFISDHHFSTFSLYCIATCNGTGL